MANIYEIDQLILSCVDAETGEIINPELLDQLQIERERKIEGIACWIKNLTADAADIKAEETVLAERRKAKENKAAALKEYLKCVLNNSPFETARCKVSFRRSQQVDILDEAAIPAEFLKKETVVKVDKKAIGDALKCGELIDGCALKENYNIQIK